MVRGYVRVRLDGYGAGAAEVWSALLENHDETDGGPRDVGVVRQVFDRSAYLEFDADSLGGTDRLGPTLVLLAGVGFDGPLATRLVAAGPGGFRPDELAVGSACRLRRGVGDGADRAYVLSVGDTMDLEVNPAALVAPEPDPVSYTDLATITAGSDPYRRAVSVLEQFEEDAVEDGLGWLDTLAELPDGAGPDGDLGRLVDDWVERLGANLPPGRPPSTAVLGRGPGATPSGDDIVSGLLLALHRTTSGGRHRRVREAGEAVVRAAGERTTAVSTALLAQAAQGRAAGRVDAAITAILGVDDAGPGWESTVRSATEIGHTSGVDLLVGVLLVPLAIGPAVARTT